MGGKMADTETTAGLAEHVRGTVVGSADADWDLSRQAYNLSVDQEPGAVVFPSDAEDVAQVVSFARENGLKVLAQRTGHGAEPVGPLEGTLLINTRELSGVRIDADAPAARVDAGARWMDLVPQASEQGLAALHGSAPDICIAGYTLGGGLGFYGRKLGLACNCVNAIEIVTGEGEQKRVDADNEPELFWALRGGGGNFGVVTALEFDLFPLEQVYAGAMFFDYARSAEVLQAWRELLPGTPEELTTVGRMLQFPPLPEVPEPMRGNSFALVEAIFMGSEDEGAELLKPLRDLGPSMDTMAMVPPAGISELHMDPPDPIPYGSDHLLLGELSEQGIDDFVAAGGPDSGSTLVSVELRQLGGALGRKEPDAGALASLDAQFLYMGVGMRADEELAKATGAALARMHDAVAPYDAGCRYSNFVEDHLDDPSSCWDAEAYARLQKAKAAYDPDGLFRASHLIPPTS
jgi:FAD/FMN-containing dehydrogenase